MTPIFPRPTGRRRSFSGQVVYPLPTYRSARLAGLMLPGTAWEQSQIPHSPMGRARRAHA